jgi:hypothetical protein
MSNEWEVKRDTEEEIVYLTNNMNSAFDIIKRNIRNLHQLIEQRGYPESKALELMRNGIANTVDFKVIEILWNEKRRT